MLPFLHPSNFFLYGFAVPVWLEGKRAGGVCVCGGGGGVGGGGVERSKRNKGAVERCVYMICSSGSFHFDSRWHVVSARRQMTGRVGWGSVPTFFLSFFSLFLGGGGAYLNHRRLGLWLRYCGSLLRSLATRYCCRSAVCLLFRLVPFVSLGTRPAAAVPIRWWMHACVDLPHSLFPSVCLSVSQSLTLSVCLSVCLCLCLSLCLC